MNIKREDLLDIITIEANCDYLSDINLPENRQRIKEVIKALVPEEYDLPQWQSALKYILGDEVSAETPGEAQKLLLEQYL